MIYKHKFIKDVFLQDKQVKTISKQQPIIFVVEREQFLDYTITTSMRVLGIENFITRLRSNDLQTKRKNMNHEVPTLIYKNIVLETRQLVQFLCDAFNQDDDFIDFESRKSFIMEMAHIWKEIFIFQKLWPHKFYKLKHLGVYNKKSYENLILKMLQDLSVNYEGKTIQRAFTNYTQDKPSLENIILVDIINCILKRTPGSLPDYYLRGYFDKLIQKSQKYENMQRNYLPLNPQRHHQVVLQSRQFIQQQNWESFRVNTKRFLIVFGFLSTIYAIYAKR